MQLTCVTLYPAVCVRNGASAFIEGKGRVQIHSLVAYAPKHQTALHCLCFVGCYCSLLLVVSLQPGWVRANFKGAH